MVRQRGAKRDPRRRLILAFLDSSTAEEFRQARGARQGSMAQNSPIQQQRNKAGGGGSGGGGGGRLAVGGEGGGGAHGARWKLLLVREWR